MITMAVAGRCPDDLCRSLVGRGVRTVGRVETTADLDRLTARRPDALVCFADGTAPDHLVRLVRAAADRLFTAVVGARDWPRAAALIQAGAHLYLVRERPADDGALAATIAAVAPVWSAHPVPHDPARGSLSRREREALAYIAAGYTHQQTASRMRVSKSTVDTFVLRIRTKLGVGNKAELATAAATLFAPGPAPRDGGPAAGPAFG